MAAAASAAAAVAETTTSTGKGNSHQKTQRIKFHSSSCEQGNNANQQVFHKLDPDTPQGAQRLASRRKAIEKGKNTIGYDEYCRQIPKDKRRLRSMETPSTPDYTLDIPNRQWNGMVKAWYVSLRENRRSCTRASMGKFVPKNGLFSTDGLPAQILLTLSCTVLFVSRIGTFRNDKHNDTNTHHYRRIALHRYDPVELKEAFAEAEAAKEEVNKVDIPRLGSMGGPLSVQEQELEQAKKAGLLNLVVVQQRKSPNDHESKSMVVGGGSTVPFFGSGMTCHGGGGGFAAARTPTTGAAVGKGNDTKAISLKEMSPTGVDGWDSVMAPGLVGAKASAADDDANSFISEGDMSEDDLL